MRGVGSADAPFYALKIRKKNKKNSVERVTTRLRVSVKGGVGYLCIFIRLYHCAQQFSLDAGASAEDNIRVYHPGKSFAEDYTHYWQKTLYPSALRGTITYNPITLHWI